MPISRESAFDLDLPKDQRANAFFSAYDLDLRVKSVRVRIGRFSYGVMKSIRFLPNTQDELVLDIGCFCEASAASTIMAGGNHANDRLCNFTFSSGRIFARMMDPENHRLTEVTRSPTTTIGNNVTISDGAIITPGSAIGTGSVIAAGAVVSGALGPLGVYGGVPAKLLKPRFEERLASLYPDFSNVAAHSVTDLPMALDRLKNGDMDAFYKSLDWLPARPVIEASMAPLGSGRITVGQITGYRIGDIPITDPSSINSLNQYFGQVHSDATRVRWLPDVFDTLRLYEPVRELQQPV